MVKYKQLIFFFVYWIIYSGLLTQFIGLSRYLEYLPDLIVLILGISLYNKKTVVPINKLLGKSILIIIGLFFLVGFISSLLSYFTLSGFLWGIRNYIRYLLLFMAVYKLFNWDDILRLKEIYIQGLKYNILFILFQTLVLGMYGDPVGGTFSGGNSSFYVFMLPGLSMVCCDYFQGEKTWKQLLFYIAGIVYFAIVGESKVVYFTLPFIIYGAYVLMKKFSMKHLVVLVLGFLFVIPVFQYFMGFYYSQEYIDGIFDLEYIEKETSNTGFGIFNRSTSIELSNALFLDNEKHFLLGYGFNSSSLSSLFDAPILHYFDFREIAAYNLFTPSFLLAEVGWIGFILFVLGHIFLLVRLWKFYRASNDLIIKNWTSVGLLTLGITFLLMWYNNKPVVEYYIMYLLWAAIAVALRCRIQELRQLKYKMRKL